jgi:hypothetical protein
MRWAPSDHLTIIAGGKEKNFSNLTLFLALADARYLLYNEGA